jgi:hypothetical protein
VHYFPVSEWALTDNGSRRLNQAPEEIFVGVRAADV